MRNNKRKAANGGLAAMKMDEYDGKQFLATVRGEDFAHAGELESIDLVFRSIPARPDWRVLDVGCGRAGTANYVNQRGWGNVVGVDIDQSSIDYAQAKYPALQFAVCDMETVGTRFPAQFNLIYLFNVFYASSEKRDAMLSFRQAAKPGALLCIFDYVTYKPEEPLPAVFLGQTPATADEFATFANDASWDVYVNRNLDKEYVRWYQEFLQRFDAPAVKNQYPSELIENVRSQYAGLLGALENGILGGVLLIARAC